MYNPYMEAPQPLHPPEYDERVATKSEVLDVVFGRSRADGLGRDYDALIGDTAMMMYAEHIADNIDAERDLLVFLGQRWAEVPASVKAVFEELAEAAAKE